MLESTKWIAMVTRAPALTEPLATNHSLPTPTPGSAPTWTGFSPPLTKGLLIHHSSSPPFSLHWYITHMDQKKQVLELLPFLYLDRKDLTIIWIFQTWSKFNNRSWNKFNNRSCTEKIVNSTISPPHSCTYSSTLSYAHLPKKKLVDKINHGFNSHETRN